MTVRPFKFRHTNEIVGAFVLTGVILLVGALVMAGRLQGWFEGKFEIRAVFDTEEGTFGLQEGNAVYVRNTQAGRVGKIVPKADGQMETTFILHERFRPFLTQDSLAKVKRKFGVTGDAFVEISKGKGPPIEDGALIECHKDEELMETANRLLKNVQDVGLPLLDEIKGILAHVNGILGSVDAGQGLVGALVKDDQMSGEIKSTIVHVNTILLDSMEAIRETTRLIRGAQKHWFLRRYMEEDAAREWFSPLKRTPAASHRVVLYWKSNLREAREANDADGVARNAFRLALQSLYEGDVGGAEKLLQEARSESLPGLEETLRLSMLEAEIARKRGDLSKALALVEQGIGALDRRCSADLRVDLHGLKADLLCDANRIEEARKEWKVMQSAAKKTDSPFIEALVARIQGRVLDGEKRSAEAALQYEQEAVIMGQAGLFYDMALALESAGQAHEKAGSLPLGADRLFRAGRSWYAGGHIEPAERSFKESIRVATLAGDAGLAQAVATFTNATRLVEAEALPVPLPESGSDAL